MKYTNHIIRPTNIVSLDVAGFEAKHIMVITCHHSEETIKCYVCKCPPKKKEKSVIYCLKSLVIHPKKKPEPEASEEVTVLNKNTTPQAELPTINIQEIKDCTNSQDELSAIIQNIEDIMAKNEQYIQSNKMQVQKQNLQPVVRLVLPVPVLTELVQEPVASTSNAQV